MRGLTDFVTAPPETLNHVLASLLGEALLTLKDDDSPAHDGGAIEELLSDHVPSTITRLNGLLLAARSILENRCSEDTGLDLKGALAVL